MKKNVLDNIIEYKQIYVANRKKEEPLEQLKPYINSSSRDFYKSLSLNKPFYILECKKASPSKGLIRENFDLEEISKAYLPLASAISVLTDEKFFQGNYSFLYRVSELVEQPVLCKDFIIDPYQVYLARYYKADAILLMLSVLKDDLYKELSSLAHSLNMGVLTEVSNKEELGRAISLNAKVIGINNRELRDLSIDLNRTLELAPYIPKGTIIVSESGIYSFDDVKKLRHVVNGFLVGSSLMSEQNIDLAARRLIYGVNKVCGLTSSKDAMAAYANGAVFGGLIFAENSPRKIDLSKAKEISSSTKMPFVGVFQDQPLEMIVDYATSLELFAVQLHGSESNSFIGDLRTNLPSSCKIWKSIDMTLEKLSFDFDVDLFVLDTDKGGSGVAFDWDLIEPSIKSRSLLAGGLNLSNCLKAQAVGCFGLDFNSGLESAKGVKDHLKIKDLFSLLRSGNI